MKLKLKTQTISLLTIGLFLSIVSIFSACKKDDNPSLQNINSIVNSNPNFSILKAAITRAGLGSVLETGTLTVFAPDNTAFAAAGIDTALINSLPPLDVANLLTYHVVGSKILSSSVPASDTVNTLQGENIYASKNANGVFVNGIMVKTADILASNGVIHVISNVLIPPTETIAEIIAGESDLSTLLSVVGGIPAILSAAQNPGKLTVFAPTDAAFSAATPPAPADIPGIIQAHIISTNVFASDLINNATAATLNPMSSILIGTSPAPNVKLSGSAEPVSNIVEADIIATNGVIHKIDRVLLP